MYTDDDFKDYKEEDDELEAILRAMEEEEELEKQAEIEALDKKIKEREEREAREKLEREARKEEEKARLQAEEEARLQAEARAAEIEKDEELDQVAEELDLEKTEGLEKLEEDTEEDTEDDRSEDDRSEDDEEDKLGFFAKLKLGLTKTRDSFTAQLNDILKSFHKVDEELFEELEELLIMSDVGMETTMDLIDQLEDRVREERVTEPERVIELLKEAIAEKMLNSVESNELNIEPSPAVILVVGVNGVGKTTTIGKLSYRLKNEGKKVLVAAGDTFRAAAIEQLEEWGNRANVDIVSHSEGSDPGAVIFDAIQAAKARKADVLICDTAGRLHNKANLMNELNKIFRIVENEYPEASKEVLLVLDATTGQNAMTQAKTFKEVANITGIALTKLDGTAKGGVVVALQSELGVPIKFIGVGEGIDDLQPFNSEDFASALFDK